LREYQTIQDEDQCGCQARCHESRSSLNSSRIYTTRGGPINFVRPRAVAVSTIDLQLVAEFHALVGGKL
jgi:hypothetical protein